MLNKEQHLFWYYVISLSEDRNQFSSSFYLFFPKKVFLTWILSEDRDSNPHWFRPCIWEIYCNNVLWISFYHPYQASYIKPEHFCHPKEKAKSETFLFFFFYNILLYYFIIIKTHHYQRKNLNFSTKHPSWTVVVSSWM